MDSIDTAVSIEQQRLESIVALAWVDGHYQFVCGCTQCRNTRLALSPEDLQFIDLISKATGSQ